MLVFVLIIFFLNTRFFLTLRNRFNVKFFILNFLFECKNSYLSLLKEVGFISYISFKGVKMNVISDLELQQIRTQMLTFAQLQVNQADLAEDLVQEAF